jgi:hypothetical protein
LWEAEDMNEALEAFQEDRNIKHATDLSKVP